MPTKRPTVSTYSRFGNWSPLSLKSTHSEGGKLRLQMTTGTHFRSYINIAIWVLSRYLMVFGNCYWFFRCNYVYKNRLLLLGDIIKHYTVRYSEVSTVCDRFYGGLSSTFQGLWNRNVSNWQHIHAHSWQCRLPFQGHWRHGASHSWGPSSGETRQLVLVTNGTKKWPHISWQGRSCTS